MLAIYGAILSPYVRKTLFVANIKGLQYKSVPQMPFTGDEAFKKISPLGKIPALVDGDFNLADSTIICEYLDDKYPDVPVYPKEPKQRAEARWLEEYGDSKVSEVASGLFFQRVMKPMFLQQDTDEAVVDEILQTKMPAVLDYLESKVPAQGFLFGEQPMVADVAIISSFINAGIAGFTVDASQWPNVASFITRVKEHPVLASMLQAEAKLLG